MTPLAPFTVLYIYTISHSKHHCNPYFYPLLSPKKPVLHVATCASAAAKRSMERRRRSAALRRICALRCRRSSCWSHSKSCNEEEKIILEISGANGN